MFYKEWKFLAAHYVLSVLREQIGYIILNNDKTQRPPTYQWTDVYIIKRKAPFYFSKEILIDAAKTMFIEYKHKDNEVDMLNDSNDTYKTEFKLLDKGLIALKDRKYLRMYLSSWKTIIGISFASLLAILGLIKLLQELKIL